MGRYIFARKENKGNSLLQKTAKRGVLRRNRPTSTSVNRIHQLQKTVGNRAVNRMIRSGTVQVPAGVIQAKEAGDQLAESMEPVQREEMPEEEGLQAKFAIQREEVPEEEALQPKFAIQREAGMEEEEALQPKFAVQREAGMEEEEALQPKSNSGNAPVQRASSGSGIPEEVQGKMAQTFQQDFSDVKVHPNSSKAPAVGALAYTQGSDIHFAPGRYNPGTTGGQQLLGHELTHVVQQREGRVQPTTQVNGMPVNDDASFEKEADAFGRKLSRL